MAHMGHDIMFLILLNVMNAAKLVTRGLDSQNNLGCFSSIIDQTSGIWREKCVLYIQEKYYSWGNLANEFQKWNNAYLKHYVLSSPVVVFLQ